MLHPPHLPTHLPFLLLPLTQFFSSSPHSHSSCPAYFFSLLLFLLLLLWKALVPDQVAVGRGRAAGREEKKGIGDGRTDGKRGDRSQKGDCSMPTVPTRSI